MKKEYMWKKLLLAADLGLSLEFKKNRPDIYKMVEILCYGKDIMFSRTKQ